MKKSSKKKPKGLATYYDRETLIKHRWHQFLAPRYWPTWLFIGFLRITAFLPYSTILFLGKNLGRLFMIVVPSRKKIAATNLKLCFPELSETERNYLLKKSFESTGIGLLEAGLAWWASDKRLKKMFIVNGLENLEKAKATHKGILIITCHFTMIELGIRLSSLITTTNVMYRPQKNHLFEWVLQKRRNNYVKNNIAKRDLRGMLKAIKNKDEIMCYTPDQDTSRNLSVFAPFFGVPASTITATSYFAEKTECSVVPGFYYRDDKEQKYFADFLPALENFPTGDAIADATRINKIIEDAIRKHPEQYMWTHRRFKTQPNDSAIGNIYK